MALKPGASKGAMRLKDAAQKHQREVSQLRKKFAKARDNEDFNVLWQPRPRDKRVF